jgi:hypothetical protein
MSGLRRLQPSGERKYRSFAVGVAMRPQGGEGRPRHYSKFTLRRFCAGVESDDAVFLAQRARVAEGMGLLATPEG